MRTNNRRRVAGIGKRSIAGITVAAFFVATVAAQPGYAGLKTAGRNHGVTKQGKFYCNINALTSEERAHHKQLGDKLNANRKEIVEIEKGYEFQYSPSDVSLPELADWVCAEAKCCPFFDFHIDVEKEGTLLCLRLTGEEGIKQFIRAEFHVEVKKKKL
jgi:hypothetical protein